jgi:hypothetical protein
MLTIKIKLHIHMIFKIQDPFRAQSVKFQFKNSFVLFFEFNYNKNAFFQYSLSLFLDLNSTSLSIPN